MAPLDGAQHHVFWQLVGAGLDHHDGVVGAGDGQVQRALFQLLEGGVGHEVAVDVAHAHGPEWPAPGNVGDAQRGRSAVHGQDVGIVLLVGRKHRDDDLDFVLIALGEQRPDGPVG